MYHITTNSKTKRYSSIFSDTKKFGAFNSSDQRTHKLMKDAVIRSKLRSKCTNTAARNPTTEKMLAMVMGWSEVVVVAKINVGESRGDGAASHAVTDEAA